MKNLKILTFSITFIFILGAGFSLTQKAQNEQFTEEVIQDFKQANEIYLKAQKYFSKNKYKEAENELKKCIEMSPYHAHAYYFLSQIYYKNGNFPQALESIKGAKSNYKTFFKLNASIKQKNLEKLSEGISELRSELNFQNTEGRRQEIRRAMIEKREELDKMRKEVKDFMSLANNFLSDYFYFEGNVFFKTRQYEKAVEQYSEAIRLNPKNGNAYNNLAIIFYMAKHYQKALDYLNQAEANGAKINPKFKEDLMKSLKK